jgi:hypothetical protein
MNESPDKSLGAGMRRVAIGCALSFLALGCGAAPLTYVHRMAVAFEPGSSDLPSGSAEALSSLVDDAKNKCAKGGPIAIEVIEVVTLPLGKVTAGPTARTQRVAQVLRDLHPYESSLSSASDRARRLHLGLNQVGVELSCQPQDT